jgi:hypothetical protein
MSRRTVFLMLVLAEQDWLEIEARLFRAYQHLKAAVAGG